jgi:hypothetical protein
MAAPAWGIGLGVAQQLGIVGKTPNLAAGLPTNVPAQQVTGKS